MFRKIKKLCEQKERAFFGLSAGIEPATYRLTIYCSNQVSYEVTLAISIAQAFRARLSAPCIWINVIVGKFSAAVWQPRSDHQRLNRNPRFSFSSWLMKHARSCWRRCSFCLTAGCQPKLAMRWIMSYWIWKVCLWWKSNQEPLAGLE